MEYFSSCPKDCYDSCSLITKVEDGIKIYGNKKHPVTSGFLCLNSKYFVEAHLSDKRLKKALLRKGKRGEGQFKEIDLNDALDLVTEKINFILKNFGPEKILPLEYAGNRALISYNFPQRFFNNLGTLRLNHSLCDEAGGYALNEFIGTSTGLDPENIFSSDLIAYWGINPAWTNVHGWAIAKKSKAKIYVLDPIRTESAKGADIHLKIRIDSDIYLVLGLINYISKFGYNLGKLTEIAKDFNIEKTSSLTGLSIDEIREFASDLMKAKFPIIHMGYGFQRKSFGGLTIKAIESLLILLGKPKNFIYDAKHKIDFDYLRGKNECRILVNQANLARELEKFDVKMIFIYNTNPLASLPNQNLLRKILIEKDIFIVVHDLFLTDTAKFADLVLPAASFFEFDDLVDSFYHDYLNLNQKIFDPPGDAISNHDLFVRLSKNLGLSDKSLFESEKDIINKILNDLRIDLKEFYRNGFAKIKREEYEINVNFNNFIDELKNLILNITLVSGYLA